MIIAIDANEANIKNRVGSNQFAFEVMWGMYKLKVKSEKLKVGRIKFLVFLQDEPLGDLPPETDWWQYEVFGPKKFWTWIGLVKRLYFGKQKPDILLSLSHYGPGLSPIPFVITVMDLGFLRFPQQFTKKDFYQLKYWTNWSVKRAAKVITISQFSRKDVINTYHIRPKKVTVAYPGWAKTLNSNFQILKSNPKLRIEKIKKKYEIGKDYLLYLGTLKPSKNIEGLAQAYKILVDNYRLSEINLVVAGKRGWFYKSIFDLVEKLNLKDKVIFTDFVPDNEVGILMAGAKVFVIPSFWEGFGIPALEAMAVGTPVVCSDQGALPEIVDNAAVIVNPYDPKDIANGIKQVLTDKKLREKLINFGRERAKMFSWDKCSKIILDVLINLIKESKNETRR